MARDRVAQPPAIPLTNCCGCLPVNEIADKGASGNNALEAHNKETAMQHVAIGLGGRKSPICVRAEDGRILHEGKIATWGLEGYLKRQPPSRVVLETCAEAFGIADQVLNLEHEVRVVPGTLPSPGSDRLRACVSSPLSMTSPGSIMPMLSRAFLV